MARDEFKFDVNSLFNKLLTEFHTIIEKKTKR